MNVWNMVECYKESDLIMCSIRLYHVVFCMFPCMYSPETGSDSEASENSITDNWNDIYIYEHRKVWLSPIYGIGYKIEESLIFVVVVVEHFLYISAVCLGDICKDVCSLIWYCIAHVRNMIICHYTVWSCVYLKLWWFCINRHSIVII